MIRFLRYFQIDYPDNVHLIFTENMLSLNLLPKIPIEETYEDGDLPDTFKVYETSIYSFENNGLYINYADSGRMRLTHLPEDRAKFKVPTLRNIALTAPYMHDGSFATINDVLEHYNNGGKNHINKSNFVKPLLLTTQEKQDLINFLHSLTDNTFIQNKNFKQ